MHRPRRRVWVLGLCAACALLALLFTTPPGFVMVWLAKSFPETLVSGSNGSRFPAAAKHLLQTYVQSGLATQMAARVQTDSQSDVAVLAAIIRAVRRHVLTDAQVAHLPRRWEALASGFGYCDQVNGAVAQVAAHFFSRAETYALYDPVRRISPHTIGRVWSDERHTWLYFDAYFDVPVIFERTSGGDVTFASPHRTPMKTRTAVDDQLYRLSGWVTKEYESTLGGQIGIKLLARLGWSDVEPAPSIDAGYVAPAGSQPSGPALVEVHDPDVFGRIAPEYAAARVEQVIDPAASRVEYLRIAADPSASRDTRTAEFAAASRLFTTSQ